MTGVKASVAAVLLVSFFASVSASVSPARVAGASHVAALTPSTDFTVRVRAPGAAWREVDAYRVIVDMHARARATFTRFDADGPIEVEVTKATGGMRSAVVRPRSFGITAEIDADGRVARFVLPKPLDVSFEVNGDRLHNLHVFVSPIERDAPKAGARGVRYYGPGVHRVPGAEHLLKVPSGTTVYLAAGAVLEGGILVDGVHDVVIRGHGILDPSAVFAENKEESIMIFDSTDVAVRDITIIGSPDLGIDILNSNRVTVAGVREINAARWSDGIDAQASRNVLIDSVFLRTSDDSIGISASTPGGAKGSTRNVVVRNSTLWADVAHAILVGVQGDREGQDVIDEITFQNVDILEHDEQLPRYQGALAVNAGDKVTVSDVRFDDVRVEDFALGQLLNLRVFFNPDYNEKPGTAVHRVLLRNLDYSGSGDLTSQISGYDASREVRDVTFENFRRNGKAVLDPADGNIQIGPHTSGIFFRTQPETKSWNDTSPSIGYKGRWSHGTRVESYRGDWHTTRTAGSRATWKFTGRQARIYGVTSPATGKVDVWVDKAYRTTIDTYSPTRRTGQLWFDTGVLGNRAHSVELRYRAAKNLLSTGRSIRLDKIEIVS